MTILTSNENYFILKKALKSKLGDFKVLVLF